MVQFCTRKGNFLYPSTFLCAIGIGLNGTRELEVARKAKDTPHLRLRIEPSLLGRLEKSAEKNGRTLTGEIVDRLDASFKRDDMQAYVDATAQRITEKMLAAVELGASKAVQSKIVEDELFEYDLKALREEYPDTPVDEHVKYLREAAARRAKLGGRS